MRLGFRSRPVTLRVSHSPGLSMASGTPLPSPNPSHPSHPSHPTPPPPCAVELAGTSQQCSVCSALHTRWEKLGGKSDGGVGRRGGWGKARPVLLSIINHQFIHCSLSIIIIHCLLSIIHRLLFITHHPSPFTLHPPPVIHRP